MLYRFRNIIFSVTALIISQMAAAQIAMPDNVNTGTSKHYKVDPNVIPGSTYTWKIGGVVQPGLTTNEINITWNTPGTFILEVQEITAAGCQGEPRSGQVIVSSWSISATSSDLAAVKTVNNSYPLTGQTVEFMIVAANNGPDAATGVTVTDILEGGYTYISSAATAGSYEISTGIWTIGTLNSGASATLLITVSVNATGPYTNNIIIAGNETDPDTDNNTSTVTTYPTDFFIPQGFSPNGDGINDLFIIRGISYFPENRFEVYNRWGVKVFEESGYANTWDGRAKRGLNAGGDELPTGTYFYLLYPGDGSAVIKGTIYLNR